MDVLLCLVSVFYNLIAVEFGDRFGFQNTQT